MQSHPKSTAVFSFAVLLILTAATSVCAQSRYFKNWPAGTSPREVGTRVAQNYLARQFEYQQGKRQFVIYPEVCARSEEHTSELQSRLHLVCRLLLEKKKY